MVYLLMRALVVLAGAAASPPPPTSASAFLVADSTEYWAFVDLLASAWTPLATSGAYDPSRAEALDARRLLSLVSADGITFSDASTDSTWHESQTDLASELGAGSGPGYAMLLHLGYIRALPYAQYSALTITEEHDTIEVRMSEWYDLSLRREEGHLRVARIAYLQTEAE
jgi:hypothetical protein